MPQVKFLEGLTKAQSVLDSKVLSEDSPKVAFAGRSNVGKSSLLNTLTGSKIARVSGEPGKTREMNFFEWRFAGISWLLVDLPGYGFAKVSKSLREQWGVEIAKWMTSDEKLILVIVLVDGRHGFFKTDLELIDFLKEKAIPYQVVFTKMDKWKSANQRKNAERELLKVSSEQDVENPVFSSAQDANGVAPVRRVFEKLKQKFL